MPFDAIHQSRTSNFRQLSARRSGRRARRARPDGTTFFLSVAALIRAASTVSACENMLAGPIHLPMGLPDPMTASESSDLRRMLLDHPGTVTHLLETLTGEPIVADVVRQQSTRASLDNGLGVTVGHPITDRMAVLEAAQLIFRMLTRSRACSGATARNGTSPA